MPVPPGTALYQLYSVPDNGRYVGGGISGSMNIVDQCEWDGAVRTEENTLLFDADDALLARDILIIMNQRMVA